jgi:hypothetical protein
MRPSDEGGMDDTSAVYQLYVGIDVAADTFTAAWLAPGGTPTPPLTGEQTPAGYAARRRRLQATRVAPASTLVVLAATGDYWVALAVALHAAGYRVAVANPRQAPHCAKAQLRRAKTAALDAQDLARLAAALQPAPRGVASAGGRVSATMATGGDAPRWTWRRSVPPGTIRPSGPSTRACAPRASRSRWPTAPPRASCCTWPGRAAPSGNASTRTMSNNSTRPCPSWPPDGDTAVRQMP